MNYLQYFFNPSHLFSLRPNAMQPRAIIILSIIFIIFIAISIASKLMSGKEEDKLKNKTLQQIFYLYLTMGIIGFVYIFFAWQKVILLGARFWILIIFLIPFIWTLFLIKYIIKDIPRIKKEQTKKREFNKYIP